MFLLKNELHFNLCSLSKTGEREKLFFIAYLKFYYFFSLINYEDPNNINVLYNIHFIKQIYKINTNDHSYYLGHRVSCEASAI